MNTLFQTVLVPHDLSRNADRALRLAVGLDPPPRKLIVLHVANAYGNPLVQRLARARARRDLARAVAAAVGRRHGLAVERRVVAGDPYTRIARAARDADGIVICTAGRTGLRYLAIGSVAEKVVRHAPVPVLSFRPDAAWPRRLFASIVVPHDLSQHSTRALRLAASLAGATGRLKVLHVAAELPEGVNRIASARLFAAERRRLRDEVAAALPVPRGDAVRVRVEAGDPFRHIVAAARPGDVIVMCTAGRTGLAHLVIGSVAEKVVRHAPVPVLTFRPGVAVRARARPRRAPDALRPARAARRSRPRR